jgi:hypothetical protein
VSAFAATLDNRTPFAAESFVVPDLEGQEVLLVVMSAAFDAVPGGALQVAEAQSPIHAADEHRGDPATSSTVHESVIALHKPFVDVLVNAHVYAPAGRAVQQAPVRLTIGDIDKTLLVTGDRRRRLGMASAARPFVRLPILWERAFGGTAADGKAELHNPIGVGFGGAKSQDPEVETEVPNVESLQQVRSGATVPVGLGAVGRSWKPRIDFAGTYDQRWLETQWPLLPTNFDPRHYQAAPTDQQSRVIRGGEDAVLVNMTPDGVWRFRLPRLDVPTHLLYEDRQAMVPMRLDTVLLEPDDRRVTMISRAVVQTIRNTGVLRQVVLGHVRPGWLRSIAQRKRYIGSDGTDIRRPVYVL